MSTEEQHDFDALGVAKTCFNIYKTRRFFKETTCYLSVHLLSTPMGVDYVVIGFDMEVQPLVTHNAA